MSFEVRIIIHNLRFVISIGFFVFEIGNMGFGLALHFSALGLATIGLHFCGLFGVRQGRRVCLSSTGDGSGVGCGKVDGCGSGQCRAEKHCTLVQQPRVYSTATFILKPVHPALFFTCALAPWPWLRPS